MSDLSSLKVGDAVLYRYMGGRYQKRVVDGITPSGQIKVAGQKFRHNGYQIGGPAWHQSYIDPFDQSILDRQAAEENDAKMRRELRDFDWRKMDAKLIAQIHALLPKLEVRSE